VDFPDIIGPSGAGATSAMTYAAPGGSAAIQWASGGSKVVTMGFPFETITTAAKRNQVMSAMLTYFDTTSTLISATPGVPDLTAATDSGANTDNRTNYNNASASKAPQFVIPGTIVGATITLYAGGTPIGSMTAGFTSTTLTASGALTLPEGNNTITARQTESGKPQSPDSPALTLIIDTVAPAAPSGLAASAASSSQINLNWDDNPEADLASYDVYRASVTGGPYIKINLATVPASSFTNSLLTPGTSYFYVTRALDTAGNVSADSSESDATTIPLNPTALTATPAGGYQINLSWTIPGGNRDGFSVERRTGSDPFLEIATVGAGISNYADSTGLAPGTNYEYRIRAYTAATYSSYDGPTSAATFIPGDANGSGLVDIDDLFAIDYGFANHLTGWINGDFNNDGIVNALDYTIIYGVF
jgi:hypothetical protein